MRVFYTRVSHSDVLCCDASHTSFRYNSILHVRITTGNFNIFQLKPLSKNTLNIPKNFVVAFKYSPFYYILHNYQSNRNYTNNSFLYSQDLGFGGCKLCLQAPVASGITDASQLSGKRIVTSFPNLARSYFDQHDTPDRITSEKFSLSKTLFSKFYFPGFFRWIIIAIDVSLYKSIIISIVSQDNDN